ncbi:MAG: N-acetyltransferase family protein [Alphaproteobacteria bacterium]|nr:N-acetyltransferase family protein [Alphaproteobacteria bacterium]
MRDTTRPDEAISTAPHPAPLVRDAAPADLAAVQAIYGHHVLTGLGSFEETSPPLDELEKRYRAVVDLGLPYLVAVLDGKVVGYAYAGAFRPRPAYRNTVENSVYVAPGMEGRGVGRALLATLVERCTAAGRRQMIAVIGGGYDNAASASLHAALGFKECALLRAVGWKFGRWVDVLMMQRPLGPGADSPPER